MTATVRASMGAGLARWRRAPARLEAYPALVPLWSFISGALPVGVAGLGYGGGAAALVLFVALAGGGLLAWPAGWRRAAAYAAAGAGLAGLALAAPTHTYRRHLPGREGFAEVRAIVTDTRLVYDPDLAWLQPDRNLELRLTAIRLSRTEPWTPCGGQVVLAQAPRPLAYGQAIEAAGALVTPAAPTLPHQFDFRAYLRTTGVTHVLDAPTVTVTAAAPHGWRRLMAGILRGRETALRGLLAGIADRQDQFVLAGMTLGLYRGMDRAQKEMYLRAGELHLFAVSGLNVAILFSILLVLLTACRVPFAARYLTIPVLLLGYTLATGAPPSALRAWFMLSVWSVGRGLRLPTQPVNTVLLAALVLLALNPLTLFQAGFLYSFLAVLAILLGWRGAQRLLAWSQAPDEWVPFRARQPSGPTRAGRLALGTGLAMLIFWLGGLGLTAWYNQLFLPAAVLTNMVAGAVAWLAMVLGTAKMVVGALALGLPLGSLDWLLGRCLTATVWLLQQSAEYGSSYGGALTVPQPPLALVVAYYVALLALLLAPLRLRVIAGRALLLAGVTALLVAGPRWLAPARQLDVLVPPGSNLPVVVLRAAGRPPLVLNAGPQSFAYPLGEWLRGEGLERLDLLLLLDPTAAGSGAAPALVAAARPGRVAVAGPARRLAATVGDAQQAAGRGWQVAADGRLDLPAASVRAVKTDATRTWTGWLNPGDGAPLSFTLRQEPLGLTVLRLRPTPQAPWREYRVAFADRARWWRVE